MGVKELLVFSCWQLQNGRGTLPPQEKGKTVNLKKMRTPTDHIIEKIRQNAGEIYFHRYEIFKLELWWYPETKSIEGFKITPYGSTLIEDNIKLKPAEESDIEDEHAKKHHSNHSPQEQELEQQEESLKQVPCIQEPRTVTASQEEKPKPPSESLHSSAIKKKLAFLTEKQKLAVLLKSYGFTERESAEIMNIPKTTYHDSLHLALKKLKNSYPTNSLPTKTIKITRQDNNLQKTYEKS